MCPPFLVRHFRARRRFGSGEVREIYARKRAGNVGSAYPRGHKRDRHAGGAQAFIRRARAAPIFKSRRPDQFETRDLKLSVLRRRALASPIPHRRLAPLADEESVRGPRGIRDRPLHEDLAARRLGTVRAKGTTHIQEARWVGFIDDAEAYAAAGFPEGNAGGPFGPPALPSNRQRSGANQVGELFPLVLVEHLMQTTEGFYDGAAELVGGLHSDRGSRISLRFVEAGRLDRLGKD